VSRRQKKEREMETDRIVRSPEVGRLTGLGKTSRWRMEREGRFPARVRIAAAAVGWKLSEIRAWMESLEKA